MNSVGARWAFGGGILMSGKNAMKSDKIYAVFRSCRRRSRVQIRFQNRLPNDKERALLSDFLAKCFPSGNEGVNEEGRLVLEQVAAGGDWENNTKLRLQTEGWPGQDQIEVLYNLAYSGLVFRVRKC